MVYKPIESEHGTYKNDAGMLFDILEAINVMTPQGKNVGWSEYASIEEAAKAFELEYIGIKEEE
jgi:hypothetical protein